MTGRAGPGRGIGYQSRDVVVSGERSIENGDANRGRADSESKSDLASMEEKDSGTCFESRRWEHRVKRRKKNTGSRRGSEAHPR